MCINVNKIFRAKINHRLSYSKEHAINLHNLKKKKRHLGGGISQMPFNCNWVTVHTYICSLFKLNDSQATLKYIMGTHRECAKWCSTFICGFACVCWVALFSGKKQNVVEYFHMCVCIWSIHHIWKKKHILLTRAQSLTWLLMWNWNIYNHWCMIKCTDIRYIVNKVRFFLLLFFQNHRI